MTRRMNPATVAKIAVMAIIAASTFHARLASKDTESPDECSELHVESGLHLPQVALGGKMFGLFQPHDRERRAVGNPLFHT
jgi:hypothetical protein